MSLEQAVADAVAEHRKAVADCVATIRAIGPGEWAEPVRPGGWTRAEIAEHLAISYAPLVSELAGDPGFAVRLPWWKRQFLRWKFLPNILRGRFPRGAPAPREIRPGTASADPEVASRRLAEQAETFLACFEGACGKRRVRLTHPYFGKLSARDVLRLLTSHANHHRRQLETPVRRAV